MQFLYHRVPSNMHGTVLYPLNELRDVAPVIAARQAAKYNDRPMLMRRRVPILDCLWNDVLHLSPVHPSIIKRELLAAGGSPPPRAWRCFVIDPNGLDRARTTVFLATRTRYAGDAFPLEEFVSFDPVNLERYAVFPPTMREYFAEEVTAGRRPLLYTSIPHILYRGSIDTEGLTIVDA